jgi:hypothetical protein
VLGAGAFEAARVAADETVLDRGGEDGFQEPVGLGRGDRADEIPTGRLLAPDFLGRYFVSRLRRRSRR